MTNNQLTDKRLVKILSETQATIMEHNSRCVRGSVEVDARLFESMIMELQERRKAAMDSEPVVFTDERNLHHIAMGRETSLIWGKQNSEAGDIPLYRHAQQPVVLDDLSIFEAAIEECKTCDSIDEHAWNHGVLAVIAKYESCRAAMLQGAENAEPRCGNSPVIPDGYVMVPREPTRQMMSQGHFAMKGTDRGKFRRIYQAMIAAAQQEVMKDEANNLSQK